MIGCVILNRQHELMGTLRFAHPTNRKARYATRHLAKGYDAWQNGTITFAELDASMKGWINHVRFADTWGLRKTVFRRLAARQKRAANQ
jgi:hypothetical protein